MVGYLSLGLAVITAVAGYAAGQGSVKAIQKRLETDFETLRKTIVYQKNCELDMGSMRQRVSTLEKSKIASDSDMSEVKAQMARFGEMLKAQGAIAVETKEMVKEIYKNGKSS